MMYDFATLRQKDLSIPAQIKDNLVCKKIPQSLTSFDSQYVQ